MKSIDAKMKFSLPRLLGTRDFSVGGVGTALCYITLHNFFKSVLMVTRGSEHLFLNMLFHNILFYYT